MLCLSILSAESRFVLCIAALFFESTYFQSLSIHVRYINRLSSFQEAAPAPYQQYPGPTPPPQGYTQGGPAQTLNPPYSQNQQYGPVVTQPQYSYNQGPPQQSFGAPPVPAPYGNTQYQAPPTSQYSNAAPLQYGRAPQMNPPQPNSAQQHVISQNAAQYSTPPNLYPANQQNGGYGGSITQSPSTFQGHPQDHWNSMQPPPPMQSGPPYQRQQRSYSDSIYRSSTPGFHAQSPQLSQGRERTQSIHKTSQTQVHPPKRNQQLTPGFSHNAPQTSTTQSSGSDIPFSRHQSSTRSVVKEADKINPGITGSIAYSSSKEDEGEDEDTLTEGQQFEFDMTWIFMDTPPKETVRLACPLSISFAVTPVPLLDPESTVPVSRFVKDVAVENFSRSIRDGPNWSALKADPAFAELNMDGPLILIDEIPRWMAQRQGVVEYVEENPAPSRKRIRPKEGGVEDNQVVIDDQIAHEADSERQEQAPPSKRQKNEEPDRDMSEDGTPVIATPTYAARDGTPCLVTDDKAWAPEPGERAALDAPAEDPMETLLASLGVTGAPKPVSREPLPPYQPLQEDLKEISKPPSSGPPKQKNITRGPQRNRQQFKQSISSTQRNGSGLQAQFSPPESGFIPQNGQHQSSAAQISPSQYGPPQDSPFQHASLQHGPNGQPQYSQNANYSYNQGQSHQHQPQLSPQGNPQYNNGPPNSNQFTHPQYGNQDQNQTLNGNQGSQQPGYLPQPQYGNRTKGLPPYTDPDGNPYGNTVNGNTINGQLQHGNFNSDIDQNGNPVNGHHQTSNASHGPPNNQPQNQQYGAGFGPLQRPDFNGQPPHNSESQQNNGHPNYFDNGAQGNISNMNQVRRSFLSSIFGHFKGEFQHVHLSFPAPGNSKHANSRVLVIQPLAQSQFGPNAQSNAPFRQDSGYSSSGGSFSNGSTQNGQPDHQNSQPRSQHIFPTNGPVTNGDLQYSNDHMNNDNQPISYGNGKLSDQEDNIHDPSEPTQDGSPLSPMSREILGKLSQPSRKLSGSKKRPAPVVDEAYR
jgi:hypothetical protein